MFGTQHVPPPFPGPLTNLRAITNATSGALSGNYTFVNKYKRTVFAALAGGKNVQLVIQSGGPTTFAAVWIGIVDTAGGINFDGNQKQVTWGGAAQLVTGSGVLTYESDIVQLDLSWPPPRDFLIAFNTTGGGTQRYKSGLSTTDYLSYARAGVQQAGDTAKTGTYSVSKGLSRWLAQLKVST